MATYGYLMAQLGSTLLLGLVFWVLATHLFDASQVGIAFAAFSTATLLSTIGSLGVNTFLMAEIETIPPARQRALFSTGSVVVAVASGVIALGAAALGHVLGKSLSALFANPLDAALFVVGTAVTGVTFVFDRSAIGLHRGSAQLVRGIVASVLKLVAAGLLVVVGSKTSATLIFAWAVGLVISTAVCLPMLRLRRSPPELSTWRGRTGLVREYAGQSWNHHVLNLSVTSVGYLVPVIAALLVTSRQYAYFGTAMTLATFILVPTGLLAMALFAEAPSDEQLLARLVRRTLPSALALSVAVVAVAELGASLALRFFGASYAVHGATIFRLLVLITPFYVLKDHYAAIRRAQGMLQRAARVVAVGTAVETTGAAVGGVVWGLPGLAVGWVIGAAAEVLFLLPAISRTYRALEPGDGSSRPSPLTKQGLVGRGARLAVDDAAVWVERW
jgi:O-antigen/teichoic acid export membrane protein